ncbi:hypothetical protein QYE76_061499 [Lolium multiflorum]|uniref:Uncharacterized protein n=1 Tax=Lolium multiflorum TaxID=4521 RepID=A0AAD8S149_LOLMU|nr:hypothetical protein QYE76_061499 [Lolium multiflorum]
MRNTMVVAEWANGHRSFIGNHVPRRCYSGGNRIRGYRSSDAIRVGRGSERSGDVRGKLIDDEIVAYWLRRAVELGDDDGEVISPRTILKASETVFGRGLDWASTWAAAGLALAAAVQSQKQRVVALSSCESEYIAAATMACQGVWLGRLLGDLLGSAPLVADLLVDNKSAIQLCKNPVYHDRSKHIDTRYHYIRDCIEDGTVTVEYIGTEDQLADILTKALGRVQFQNLRERIGVINLYRN